MANERKESTRSPLFFFGGSTQAVSEAKQSFEAECRDKNTILKE